MMVPDEEDNVAFDENCNEVDEATTNISPFFCATDRRATSNNYTW